LSWNLAMPSSRRNTFKTPSEQTIARALDNLLEGYYPPPSSLVEHGLNKMFTRRQDDTDGERGPEQYLSVGFTADGDAWVFQNAGPVLRFRKEEGGGLSPRLQRALMVVAEAIRRDNEARPQSAPEYIAPE